MSSPSEKSPVSAQVRLLISKREAAAALSVSVRTLENYINAKKLVARKIGRRTLIPVVPLEAFARHDHPSLVNGNGDAR